MSFSSPELILKNGDFNRSGLVQISGDERHGADEPAKRAPDVAGLLTLLCCCHPTLHETAAVQEPGLPEGAEMNGQDNIMFA